MLVTKIRSRGFFMYLFEHYFFSLIAPVAMINRALFFTNYDLRFTISHIQKKKSQIIVILLWESENCLLVIYEKQKIFTKVFLKLNFHAPSFLLDIFLEFNWSHKYYWDIISQIRRKYFNLTKKTRPNEYIAYKTPMNLEKTEFVFEKWTGNVG